MTTIYAVDLIATVCDENGPTGECREVLEAAVVDYGGSEYGRAKTRRGVERIQRRLRIPTRLRATKLGQIVPAESYVSGYTIDCGFC